MEKPRIDAHQHFWSLARGDYDWLTADNTVLYRDFQPEDLAPHLAGAGITHTVAVQAAPTQEETRFLIGLAETTPTLAAVVGWVDLEDANAGQSLETLAAHDVFRGIRPMIQDIADDQWMLGEALAPGLRALTELGLSFDALVLPRHLAPLLTLLKRHPDLPVVIDHGAKPAIAANGFQAWAEPMTRLASETTCLCKLSGLVTEASPAWKTEDLRPYVMHLLETFGPQRLMWGSDWPVVEMAGGFARWREASDTLLGELSETERSAILGGNAARFYRLTLNG